MPGSRLMTATRPRKPSSRRVTAALPPATPPPTITIGLRPIFSNTEHTCPPWRCEKFGALGEGTVYIIGRTVTHTSRPRLGGVRPAPRDAPDAEFAQAVRAVAAPAAAPPPRRPPRSR